MKNSILLFTLSFLIGSQVFAGAYGLNCSDSEKSVTLDKGDIQLTLKDGSVLEGVYYADLSDDLMGQGLQDFLKDTSEKFYIESSDQKVLSKKSFKDSCGNSGQRRKFKQSVVILNSKGDVLKETSITCKESIITGHCY